MAGDEGLYRTAERRIEYLTLVLGVTVSLAAGIGWGWRDAVGVALGTGVAWVNYRWLKQGVGAMARLAATQAGTPKPRLPKNIYVRVVGRFVLLLVVAYVMLSRRWLPGVAVLLGLFSLVAAVLIEMLYQLVRRQDNTAGHTRIS